MTCNSSLSAVCSLSKVASEVPLATRLRQHEVERSSLLACGSFVHTALAFSTWSLSRIPTSASSSPAAPLLGDHAAPAASSRVPLTDRSASTCRTRRASSSSRCSSAQSTRSTRSHSGRTSAARRRRVDGLSPAVETTDSCTARFSLPTLQPTAAKAREPVAPTSPARRIASVRSSPRHSPLRTCAPSSPWDLCHVARLWARDVRTQCCSCRRRATYRSSCGASRSPLPTATCNLWAPQPQQRSSHCSARASQCTTRTAHAFCSCPRGSTGSLWRRRSPQVWRPTETLRRLKADVSGTSSLVALASSSYEYDSRTLPRLCSIRLNCP